MALLNIPIDPLDPAFSFYVELDGKSYQFDFRWNGRTATWMFDIYDETQTAVQLGVPFNLNIQLLRQNVRENRPPGRFVGIAAEGVIAATRFDLGVDNAFLYIDEEGLVDG